METIKERQIIEYDLNELNIMQKETQVLLLQIQIKSDKGINILWENQKKCGEEVRNIFNDKSIINCLVYGLTQTGKTGCMTSVIEYYILSNNIPIDNIYIITGLSDIQWKKDTKNRMPETINERVFHRANLSKKFLKEIREKQNVLIIMDEIQIACEENQTIHKTFDECGFYDLDFLLENDIKLVQFSATPDGNINDISDWKNHSSKIKLTPGENYYGPKEALQLQRVKQFKDLTDLDNVRELKNEIENNFVNRYHLIRVPSKRTDKKGINKQQIVINNFIKIFGDYYNYNYNYLNKKKGDINDILKNKPKKNTFIFYCEILRCAKTQYKEFIGISYERFVENPSDSTIVQGTFGRDTGYDNNGVSICYTNISSLENYVKLWDNNMEFKEGIKWNSKSSVYDEYHKLTYSTGTYNSVKYIDELSSGSSQKIKIDRGDPNIEKFYGEDGQEKMLDWFKNNLRQKLGKRGPNKKCKVSHFYKGAIRKGLQILSTTEVDKEKKWGFDDGPAFRSYPCYSNINDPNTLEWWLIYYDE